MALLRYGQTYPLGAAVSATETVTLSPDTKRIGLWQLYDDNVMTLQLLAFLRRLRRILKTKLVVVIGRLSVHRSVAKLLRKSRARWLEAEYLPALTPDLNPVEAVCSCAKHVYLENYAPFSGRVIRPSTSRPTRARFLPKTARLSLE
ncbi:MAG TPA: transposase [Pirellulaceae bacterium]|jgi:transposase|nr:transposase [Pirellulaceae bacterium]